MGHADGNAGLSLGSPPTTLGPRRTECLGAPVCQRHVEMPLYGFYADHADSDVGATLVATVQPGARSVAAEAAPTREKPHASQQRPLGQGGTPWHDLPAKSP